MNVEEADGKPKEIQAQHSLDQAGKDEANVKISVLAPLPACFDQKLLDFIAALVKATKVVEIEKARGDVGYSGDIPVELGVYRNTGWEKRGETVTVGK